MIKLTTGKEFKTRVRVFDVKKTYEDFDKLINLGLMKNEGGALFSNLNLDRSGEIYTVCDFDDLETVRLLGFRLANLLRKEKVEAAYLKCQNPKIIYLLEGVLHSNYEFDRYRSVKEEDKEIELSVNEEHAKALKELKNVMDGIFTTRDLINLPPMELYPESYANRIVEIFKDTNVSVEVLDKKQIEALNMHAFLAVGSGSSREPRFVVLRYLPLQEKEHLTIVGKGLTYDSGGYAIKPATSMVTMHSDMSGSAVVVGLFKALNANKVKKNVVGVMALAENMISGHAYKNGDVISSMKGLSIEVGNTDAEGRLTLADALYYAATKLNSKEIVELSTLTGAVVVSLGTDMAGVITNSDSLYEEIHEAGILHGEFNWRLPITKELSEKVKGTFGDLRNSIPGGGGTITAGIFLTKFVEDKPFLHLDIAGVAYGEKKKYYKEGGYGFGVKTLYHYVTNKK
ncbi:MAG: leucyl aminopeptidase family protein [Acholeplasmatales bacterium]